MKHEADWWLAGFSAAFLFGLALTLIYTWILAPRTPPTTPADLNPADKETYILLAAAAYRHDGNLQKAQTRLARLKDPAIAETVAALADRYIANNADVRDIRSLVSLANALGAAKSYMLVYLVTPTPTPTAAPTPSPTATRTPTASPTPRLSPTVLSTITPRPTPTPGPNAPFELAQSVPLCDNTANSVLRVYVRDWQGKGVPGAELLVSWPGGQNRFFTGFKSIANPGYADFQMEPDQTYQVELVNAPGLAAKGVNQAAQTLCLNLPPNIAPSWQVVFQQGAGR